MNSEEEQVKINLRQKPIVNAILPVSVIDYLLSIIPDGYELTVTKIRERMSEKVVQERVERMNEGKKKKRGETEE